MSWLLYRGPSRLDMRTPIVVLATDKSSNRKTGDMLQTWILLRDADPVTAVKTNQDHAICGQCPHLGDAFKNRSCYVNVAQGPNAVYRSQKSSALADPREVGRGRLVRLGAYGDPAAVPYEVWQELLSNADGWTGYTHQWRTCDQRLKQFCMASVEDEGLRATAKALGWRTYRTAPVDAAPATSEVLCPASEEADHKVVCADCLYCNGAHKGYRGDVMIPVHGSPAVVKAFSGKVAAPNLSAVVSTSP